MQLEHWHTERDGPLTEANLRRKLEDRGFHVIRYLYAPGTYFPPHDHGVDKLDAVLCGRFRLTLEGETHVLGPGDLAMIPKHRLHSAEVVGEEPVVSLDGMRRP